MAKESAARRVGLIVAIAASAMIVFGMVVLSAVVPQKIIYWLVILAALPVWAIVRAVDGWAFSPGRLATWPNSARVAIVIAVSAAIIAGVIAAVLIFVGVGTAKT